MRSSDRRWSSIWATQMWNHETPAGKGFSLTPGGISTLSLATGAVLLIRSQHQLSAVPSVIAPVDKDDGAQLRAELSSAGAREGHEPVIRESTATLGVQSALGVVGPADPGGDPARVAAKARARRLSRTFRNDVMIAMPENT